MWLICGLGNIGRQYDNTRHNVGFEVINILSKKHKAELGFKEKFKGEIAQIQISGIGAVIVKPHTYMNLSGQCLQPLISYYKITLDNVIVVHDDLDLDLGKIKAKIGGGNAGHNGLKSLDQSIGKDYMRVRVGIGRPNHDNISYYVLSKFKSDEQETIDIASYKIVDSIPLLFDQNFEQFTKHVNQ
jgi:PTH1 family peptidyl-tRNA hydrolase